MKDKPLANVRVAILATNDFEQSEMTAPPDAPCVGVAALVRPNSGELAHLPLTLAGFPQIDPGAGEALDPILLIHAPTAEVVGAGDHAWRENKEDRVRS